MLFVGYGRPSLKDLYTHVAPTIADRWNDVGVQLLDSKLVDRRVLEVIKANHPHSVEECCRDVLKTWLYTQSRPNWNELIDAIKKIGLCTRASQLKTMLNNGGKYSNIILCYRMYVCRE